MHTQSPHPSTTPARESHVLRRALTLTFLGVLLAFMLAPGAALAGPWTKQYYQSYGLSDIEFVDAQHGWAVGGAGSIVATADGGATWKLQAGGTTEALESVDFVDTLYGWAVGYKGTIVRTTDGGATWIKQTSGFGDVLFGVSFVSRTQGWACGYWGAILTTTDGGATWNRVIWPFGDNVYVNPNWMGAAFADATHGWLVGSYNIAWPTGGTPPWARVTPNYPKDTYRAIDCISATQAVVVGGSSADPANGSVAYSTSNGTTWNKLPTPAVTETFWDVSTPSATSIWIIGSGGTVWTSTDAGTTWTTVEKPSTGYGSIDFVTPTLGWTIAGPGGTIYKYGSAPAAKPLPKALANVSVKKGKTARLRYRVDGTADRSTVTITIKSKSKTVKSFTIKNVAPNKNMTKQFTCRLKKGTYTWSVTATADGVKSAKASSKKLTVK